MSSGAVYCLKFEIFHNWNRIEFSLCFFYSKKKKLIKILVSNWHFRIIRLSNTELDSYTKLIHINALWVCDRKWNRFRSRLYARRDDKFNDSYFSWVDFFFVLDSEMTYNALEHANPFRHQKFFIPLKS